MAMTFHEHTKLSIHNHFGGPEADCKLEMGIETRPHFDLERGYQALESAHDYGFKLLAQTNSNNLDAASYLLMRYRAKLLGIELLPGAELNLLNWSDESRVLHTVVVFSPSVDVFQIQEKMRECFRENGRFVITIDQLCDLLFGRRALLSFHGSKQGKRSMSWNREMAQDLLSLTRFLPVAIEDNKPLGSAKLKERLKEFITEEQYEWLDVQAASVSAVDRFDFSSIESPTYIWADSTFDDLYYCVLTGSRRIVREADIVEPVSYISKITVDAGGGMLASRVSCSQGLNCIVGTSGSGKTLLLDIIRNKLDGRHLERSSSSTSTYDQLYDASQIHLYGPNGKEVDSSDGFEIIEGSNLYDRVIKAYSSDRSELVADFGIDIDPKAYSNLIRGFSMEASRYLSSMAEARRYGELIATCLAQIKSAI